MSKQPYIPLYIGDWERDANCLTSLAEFALLKLTFKLFNAEKRGVFVANFRTLSVLFKSNIDETKEIFQELIDNNILEISTIKEDTFEIKSRRMMREGDISEIRSEIGKKGGKAKRKQKGSKREAKPKQNTDIDIDIEYDINKENIGEIAKIFTQWLNYKFDRGETYKTKDSKNISFKKLLRFSQENSIVAASIIEEAIGNNWAGFFEPKATITKKPVSKFTR